MFRVIMTSCSLAVCTVRACAQDGSGGPCPPAGESEGALCPPSRGVWGAARPPMFGAIMNPVPCPRWMSTCGATPTLRYHFDDHCVAGVVSMVVSLRYYYDFTRPRWDEQCIAIGHNASIFLEATILGYSGCDMASGNMAS